MSHKKIKSIFSRSLQLATMFIVTIGVTAFFGASFVFAQTANTGQPVQTVSPIDATTNPVTSQGTNTVADNVCKGVLSAETGDFAPNTTISSCYESGDSSFGFIVRKIINIFSVVVGAVSVIMIIIGGFRYIISGGDSSGVSAAKNTILYAVVGLVIVVFAQVIIRFILTNVVAK